MAEYVVLMFFILAHFARIRYHNDCNNWENTSFQAIKNMIMIMDKILKWYSSLHTDMM